MLSHKSWIQVNDNSSAVSSPTSIFQMSDQKKKLGTTGGRLLHFAATQSTAWAPTEAAGYSVVSDH